MGNYDMLPRGSQVKCWECEYERLDIGSLVESYYPEYIVLLEEGGFVWVKDGIITEIVEDKKPRYPEEFGSPCIDKWGNNIPDRESLKNHTPFGYDYYFMHEEKE